MNSKKPKAEVMCGKISTCGHSGPCPTSVAQRSTKHTLRPRFTLLLKSAQSQDAPVEG